MSLAFKPTDFYAILYDIADSMPIVVDDNGTEIACKRLQTMAVVKNYASEIKSANLGKDSRYIGKKIYFTRAADTVPENGLRFDYPALFLGEQEEAYTNKGAAYNVTYSLAISDRYEQAQGENFNQGFAASRTYEEVAQDLRDLWQALLRTLFNYVYADVYDLGSSLVFTGWISEAALIQMQQNNEINSYDVLYYLEHYISPAAEGRVSFDYHTENALTYFAQMQIRFENCVAPIAARPQDLVINPIVPNDPDAQLLLNAVIAQGGTLTPAQEQATNIAIIALKNSNLWNKAYALYFMIGGNAASHRLNAKEPTGDSADYSLSFFGGWLHSSTGAKPNGINTYANTFFTPSLNASVSSIAISYYCGDNTAGAYIEMGAVGNQASAGSGQIFIAPSINGTNFRAVNTTGNFSNPSAGLPAAMYIASRTDVTSFTLHRNDLQIGNDSGLPNTASNATIYIGARNNNGIADAISARECRFSAIFSGLSALEAQTLYTIIQQFQTATGRNI